MYVKVYNYIYIRTSQVVEQRQLCEN